MRHDEQGRGVARVVQVPELGAQAAAQRDELGKVGDAGLDGEHGREGAEGGVVGVVVRVAFVGDVAEGDEVWVELGGAWARVEEVENIRG